MKITATLETGRDYYWRRSEGWTGLDGRLDAHWEYYVEFSGFNGAGGAWIIEKVRHHGCRWYPASNTRSGSEWFCRQPRTLSAYETWKLIREIHAIAADRADYARMAKRENEKDLARDHHWESWQLHRSKWFPSKWGIA